MNLQIKFFKILLNHQTCIRISSFLNHLSYKRNEKAPYNRFQNYSLYKNRSRKGIKKDSQQREESRSPGNELSSHGAGPVIVAAGVLNCCVRHGYRCVHSAIITRSLLEKQVSCLSKLNNNLCFDKANMSLFVIKSSTD